MNGKNIRTWVWVSRLLIAIVTALNLQAAFYFMLRPQDYAPGFELSGVAGEAMIQGLGLLFLMWNIPYLFAAVHPLKNYTSLIEAVIMQFIGVSGESLILFTLPGQHSVLHSSVQRFILFDGGGLIALMLALLIASRVKTKLKGQNSFPSV